MVNTATQSLTFEDYLSYDDGTDNPGIWLRLIVC